MKECTKCKEVKDFCEFGNNKTNKDKLQNECKVCNRKRQADIRRKNNVPEKKILEVTETSKECGMCYKIKSHDDFYNDRTGVAGKYVYCIDCTVIYRESKRDKQKCKERTQKYRDENREWWRSLHRINQFNRRKNIKLVSDNTVTKEFVISVYNIETCYYCKEFIQKENRTLEHLVPLSRGGKHSAENITMCCFACNVSKRNKTEDEYLNYVENIKINETK